MKITGLPLILLVLASCSTIDQAEKNIVIDTQVTEIIEERSPQIDWLGKDISLTCTYPEHPADSTTTMIESIIQNHPEVGGQESGMHFGQFVREYCTDGAGRYIFYSDDKAPISFGRYDRELDIFEGAGYDTYFITSIAQFAQERGTGFGKRSGATIEFSQKNIPYYPYTMKDFTFQKKENMEYCKRLFRPASGYENGCSYDAYYTYDFASTNGVMLKKICLFYTENNERKALESCRYNPFDEESRAQDKNNIKILYVGENSVSEAEYYISIECTKDDTSHSQIELIPDDADIEIYIGQACNTTRINPKVLDFLTLKKFKTVSWFREVFPEAPLYQFTTGEIEKIARANWQYLDIEELKTEQYKMIRNTKNPYRIGFGFSTIMDIYTQEEQMACKRYLEEISGSHDEEVWKRAREKMFECYRSLPPLP